MLMIRQQRRSLRRVRACIGLAASSELRRAHSYVATTLCFVMMAAKRLCFGATTCRLPGAHNLENVLAAVRDGASRWRER